ncbi:MAG TPA: hypothetical protein VE801_13775 [Xanthobacteraceae bacterium]|jgi:hypothetical protein|nr:hypothetical protein [Xanthobacteraceae bacterium]
MTAATGWLIFRILRWALWLASIGYYFYFWIGPERHLDQFGHLTYATEAFMFGLPLAAIFMGFLEMMMRERAGLPRPTFGWVTRPQDLPAPKSDRGPRDQ